MSLSSLIIIIFVGSNRSQKRKRYERTCVQNHLSYHVYKCLMSFVHHGHSILFVQIHSMLECERDRKSTFCYSSLLWETYTLNWFFSLLLSFYLSLKEYTHRKIYDWETTCQQTASYCDATLEKPIAVSLLRIVELLFRWPYNINSI